MIQSYLILLCFEFITFFFDIWILEYVLIKADSWHFQGFFSCFELANMTVADLQPLFSGFPTDRVVAKVGVPTIVREEDVFKA